MLAQDYACPTAAIKGSGVSAENMSSSAGFNTGPGFFVAGRSGTNYRAVDSELGK